MEEDVRPRVLIVGAYPLPGEPPQGGVETSTLSLTRALRQYSRTRCAVLALRNEVGPDMKGESSTRVIDYAITGRLGARTLNRLVERVQTAVAEHECNVVHVHANAMLAWKLQRWIDVPVLLTVHGIAERDVCYTPGRARLIKWVYFLATERFARRRVRNVIAISDATVEYLDVERQRVWKIGNAVSEVFFDAHSTTRRKWVVFAGRIRPIKNVLGLVQAFRQVADDHPDAELIIVGEESDPIYKARCVSEAARLDLIDRVNFVGAVDESVLAEMFVNSACLAVPSHQENAPMVIAEAAACGLPVVGTNVGGVARMLDDYGTGTLVEPGDIRSLARGLSNVLAKKTRAPRHNGLAQKHRPATVARATERVYLELLVSSRGSVDAGPVVYPVRSGRRRVIERIYRGRRVRRGG